jgi:hypothetical protein
MHFYGKSARTFRGPIGTFRVLFAKGSSRYYAAIVADDVECAPHKAAKNCSLFAPARLPVSIFCETSFDSNHVELRRKLTTRSKSCKAHIHVAQRLPVFRFRVIL